MLLYGFAGTHRTWDPVLPELDHERYNPLVPDLRGHGTKAGVRPISFDGCVPTCWPPRPTSSCCAATRWAVVWPSMWLLPHPSVSRG